MNSIINNKQNPTMITYNKINKAISCGYLREMSEDLGESHIGSKISIAKTELSLETEIYDWRKKTQFPVVKVKNYSISKEQYNTTQMEVSCESIQCTVDDLSQLPLFKILYLLKESIVGYERLFSRFGCFEITAKMMAINSSKRCKVWLNECFSSNRWISSEKGQIYMMNLILNIFYEKSQKNMANTLFFHELQLNEKSFSNIIKFIQRYSKENKIMISNSFQKEIKVKMPRTTTETKHKCRRNIININMSANNGAKNMNSLKRLSANDQSKYLVENVKMQIFKRRNQLEQIKEEKNQIKLWKKNAILKESRTTKADIDCSGKLETNTSENMKNFDQIYQKNTIQFSENVKNPQYVNLKSKSNLQSQQFNSKLQIIYNKSFSHQFSRRKQPTSIEYNFGKCINFLSGQKLTSNNVNNVEESQNRQDNQMKTLLELNKCSNKFEDYFNKSQLNISIVNNEPLIKKQKCQRELLLLKNYGKFISENNDEDY